MYGDSYNDLCQAWAPLLLVFKASSPGLFRHFESWFLDGVSLLLETSCRFGVAFGGALLPRASKLGRFGRSFCEALGSLWSATGSLGTLKPTKSN